MCYNYYDVTSPARPICLICNSHPRDIFATVLSCKIQLERTYPHNIQHNINVYKNSTVLKVTTLLLVCWSCDITLSYQLLFMTDGDVL
jgi:hypothetical protein